MVRAWAFAFPKKPAGSCSDKSWVWAKPRSSDPIMADSWEPTGDGEAISQSAPLKARSLSLFPLGPVHSDVHGDLPPRRLTGTEKKANALNSARMQRFWGNFRDSYFDEAGEAQYTVPVKGERGWLAPSAKALAQPYPEYEAQSHKDGFELGLQGHFLAPPSPEETEEKAELVKFIGSEGNQLLLACPRWGIVGVCKCCGTQYCKELICNREWCPHCGGDGGRGHLRRIAVKLDKARQIEGMGKFVITVPPEIRDRYRDPLKLAALGVSLKRMLQYHGYERGFRRFHFFGEDHPKHGKQREGPPKFHPHLEAIVEGGYLPPAKLAAIKKSIAHILKVNWKRVNIHYRYVTDPQRKMHMLRYMLRPTFERYEWDPALAHALVEFKNANSWGVWHHKVRNAETGRWVNGELLPPVWAVPESESVSDIPMALQQGICPMGGGKIVWGDIMPTILLQAPWWGDKGGGYWVFAGLARDG